MTTQVKRDGSDDLHRRKTEPVGNYSTPMNTVDTERLEQLRTIGVPFAGATNDDIRVFDCRILLEWATSLTNEAELRGRLSETDYWFGKPVDMNTRPINDKSVAERKAALLKLKGGEEKQ